MTFWKGKKVLVTGHTGFKGTWLVTWLKRLGADVTGYSVSVPTEPSMFKIINAERGMASIFGDIRDYDFLKQVMTKCKPEIIFHLAAQALVLRSYDSPIETYSTNIMGTANLLDIAKDLDCVKTVINVTSDKCYENKGETEHTEHDRMGGHDPYSSSKGCSEIITSSFRRSFFDAEGKGLASARAGNVIGGGDWGKDRLIPDIIRGMANNDVHNRIKIRNEDATRPWQHVLDPLNGYLMLAEKLYHDRKYASGWNFGSDSNKPVLWIMEKFNEIWQKQIFWEVEKINKYESKYLKLNCEKADLGLGWKPKLDILESVRWTIEWYQNNFNKINMAEFTDKQIERFEAI